MLSDDERLRQSTVNFKSVGDSSVPVVLNIFGKMLSEKKPNVKTLQNVNKLLLFLNFSCALSYFTDVATFVFLAGLQSCKSGNYEDAFLCFAAAAKQGYNKAQFNTGVCYEKGRGVQKDKEKVNISNVISRKIFSEIKSTLSLCFFPRL